MIELKKILLPTDFSDYSKHALSYACAFAEQFNSELHLLHVVQDLVTLVPEPGLAFPASGEYLEELKESAQQALKKSLDPAWEEGRTVVRATTEGPAFLEIIRYARDNDIDLLVMGTHGRSGLTHVLLGSVAEKVVRKAPCPVLTIRHPEHEFVMP